MSKLSLPKVTVTYMILVKHNIFCGVFIDLKKAFDAVNHSKSLNIMESEVYLYSGFSHTCLVENNMSQLLVMFLKLWKFHLEPHKVLCLDHYFSLVQSFS